MSAPLDRVLRFKCIVSDVNKGKKTIDLANFRPGSDPASDAEKILCKQKRAGAIPVPNAALYAKDSSVFITVKDDAQAINKDSICSIELRAGVVTPPPAEAAPPVMQLAAPVVSTAAQPEESRVEERFFLLDADVVDATRNKRNNLMMTLSNFAAAGELPESFKLEAENEVKNVPMSGTLARKGCRLQLKVSATATGVTPSDILGYELLDSPVSQAAQAPRPEAAAKKLHMDDPAMIAVGTGLQDQRVRARIAQRHTEVLGEEQEKAVDQVMQMRLAVVAMAGRYCGVIFPPKPNAAALAEAFSKHVIPRYKGKTNQPVVPKSKDHAGFVKWLATGVEARAVLWFYEGLAGEIGASCTVKDLQQLLLQWKTTVEDIDRHKGTEMTGGSAPQPPCLTVSAVHNAVAATQAFVKKYEDRDEDIRKIFQTCAFNLHFAQYERVKSNPQNSYLCKTFPHGARDEQFPRLLFIASDAATVIPADSLVALLGKVEFDAVFITGVRPTDGVRKALDLITYYDKLEVEWAEERNAFNAVSNGRSLPRGIFYTGKPCVGGDGKVQTDRINSFVKACCTRLPINFQGLSVRRYTLESFDPVSPDANEAQDFWVKFGAHCEPKEGSAVSLRLVVGMHTPWDGPAHEAKTDYWGVPEKFAVGARYLETTAYGHSWRARWDLYKLTCNLSAEVADVVEHIPQAPADMYGTARSFLQHSQPLPWGLCLHSAASPPRLQSWEGVTEKVKRFLQDHVFEGVHQLSLKRHANMCGVTTIIRQMLLNLVESNSNLFAIYVDLSALQQAGRDEFVLSELVRVMKQLAKMNPPQIVIAVDGRQPHPQFVEQLVQRLKGVLRRDPDRARSEAFHGVHATDSSSSDCTMSITVFHLLNGNEADMDIAAPTKADFQKVTTYADFIKEKTDGPNTTDGWGLWLHFEGLQGPNSFGAGLLWGVLSLQAATAHRDRGSRTELENTLDRVLPFVGGDELSQEEVETLARVAVVDEFASERTPAMWIRTSIDSLKEKRLGALLLRHTRDGTVQFPTRVVAQEILRRLLRLSGKRFFAQKEDPMAAAVSHLADYTLTSLLSNLKAGIYPDRARSIFSGLYMPDVKLYYCCLTFPALVCGNGGRRDLLELYRRMINYPPLTVHKLFIAMQHCRVLQHPKSTKGRDEVSNLQVTKEDHQEAQDIVDKYKDLFREHGKYSSQQFVIPSRTVGWMLKNSFDATYEKLDSLRESIHTGFFAAVDDLATVFVITVDVLGPFHKILVALKELSTLVEKCDVATKKKVEFRGKLHRLAKVFDTFFQSIVIRLSGVNSDKGFQRRKHFHQLQDFVRRSCGKGATLRAWIGRELASVVSKDDLDALATKRFFLLALAQHVMEGGFSDSRRDLEYQDAEDGTKKRFSFDTAVEMAKSLRRDNPVDEEQDFLVSVVLRFAQSPNSDTLSRCAGECQNAELSLSSTAPEYDGAEAHLVYSKKLFSGAVRCAAELFSPPIGGKRDFHKDHFAFVPERIHDPEPKFAFWVPRDRRQPRVAVALPTLGTLARPVARDGPWGRYQPTVEGLVTKTTDLVSRKYFQLRHFDVTLSQYQRQQVQTLGDKETLEVTKRAALVVGFHGVRLHLTAFDKNQPKNDESGSDEDRSSPGSDDDDPTAEQPGEGIRDDPEESLPAAPLDAATAGTVTAASARERLLQRSLYRMTVADIVDLFGLKPEKAKQFAEKLTALGVDDGEELATIVAAPKIWDGCLNDAPLLKASVEKLFREPEQYLRPATGAAAAA